MIKEAEAGQNPTTLSVYLMDEEIAQPEQGEGFDGGGDGEDGVQILQSGLIVLDPLALDQINPHFAEVVNMPIVRMELFADLVIDVEFVSARTRWKGPDAWDPEAGELPDAVEDGFIIRGRILEPNSGYVVLRVRDSGAFGAISIDGIHHIELRRVLEPVHTVNLLGVNEWGSVTDMADTAEQIGEVFEAMQGCPNPTGCPGGCDDGCTIDVLMVYTPAAAAAYQNIEDAIETRIGQVNAILVESGIIDGEQDLLRVVYIGMVDYDEAGQGANTIVGILQESLLPDFASVHTLRDSLRADLVQLWISGTGGVAGGAFSTIGNRTAVTIAHEFGHNFGLRHDHFQHCTCTGCDACAECFGCDQNMAYGWHFTTVGGQGQPSHYRTIMAYPYPECFQSSTKVEYFSNPIINFPRGNQPAMGSECANAALFIKGDEDHFGSRYRVARNRTSQDTTNMTFIVEMTGPAPCYETTLPNRASEMPSISANGQDVAFASYATNLAGIQKNNPARDVCYYDRESGLITLSSHAFQDDISTGNGDSFHPAISGNRRYIAFTSTATNIINDPQVADQQIFLHNRYRDTTDELNAATHFLISIAANGLEAGDDASDYAAVSHDGSHVAFQSLASNLVTGDENDASDIFIHSRIWVEQCENGHCEDEAQIKTVRVSVSTSGTEADGPSFRPDISETGRFVAFESLATNLAPGDTDGISNIILRDRDLNESGDFDEDEEVWTFRISRAWNHDTDPVENVPDAPSTNPSVSGDGERIAFHSSATNLIEAGTTLRQVYVFDRSDSSTILVSRNSSGGSANGSSSNPRISADGRYVVFESTATDLLDSGPTPMGSHIFVHDLETEETILVSRTSDDSIADGLCVNPDISADGRFVSFESIAENLGANGVDWQVFLRDRGPQLIGDLNGDGVVDEEDLDILLFNWGDCACCAADLNKDGVVDEDDLEELCAAMDVPAQGCPE